MMKYFYSLLLLAFALSSKAQDKRFERANEAYQKGEFETAVHIYDSIAASGYESAALYYNLGNAQYKLGALAPAILNYEKALHLKPNDEEVKHNLKLAEQKRVDRFEELPPNLFKALRFGVLLAFSPTHWAIIAIALLFIASLGVILYFFSAQRRLGFVLALSLSVLGLFSAWMAFQHQAHLEQHPGMIIMSESAYVKSGPGAGAEDLFILHAGTKVVKVDEYESWTKIRLIDGKIGWLPQESVAAIY